MYYNFSSYFFFFFTNNIINIFIFRKEYLEIFVEDLC